MVAEGTVGRAEIRVAEDIAAVAVRKAVAVGVTSINKNNEDS